MSEIDLMVLALFITYLCAAWSFIFGVKHPVIYRAVIMMGVATTTIAALYALLIIDRALYPHDAPFIYAGESIVMLVVLLLIEIFSHRSLRRLDGTLYSGSNQPAASDSGRVNLRNTE